MRIVLKDFTNEAASKAKGLLLKERIIDNMGEANIEVDFSGIERFASPFFNNSFSALALAYGFEKIESIQLVEINEIGKCTYDMSIENAKLLANNEEFIDEINTIINSVPKKEGE